MDRLITTMLVTPLLLAAMSPLSATVVHKWVDADGVTHYSDERPTSAQTSVTEIELAESGPANADSASGKYSIANQWRRMHRERLEREKLALEKARLNAQQKANTEVVYVDRPRQPKTIISYPRFRKLQRQRGHYRSHYDYRQSYRHSRSHRYRKTNLAGSRRDNNLGYYKQVQ